MLHFSQFTTYTPKQSVRLYSSCIRVIVFFFFCMGALPGYSQGSCRMVMDTLSKGFRVEKTGTHLASRTTTYDIRVSVTPNADRPESTVDITLDIGPGVEIDSLYTVSIAIFPDCEKDCLPFGLSSAFLSSNAVDKQRRRLQLTLGGLMPESDYYVQTAVFGLDGPCSGELLDNVYFKTRETTLPGRMLIVIDKEWENHAKIQASIDRYVQNVQRVDQEFQIERQYVGTDFGSKTELRRYIRDAFIHRGLTHLFFVGDNAPLTMRRTILNDDGSVEAVYGTETFAYYFSGLNIDQLGDSGLLETRNYRNACIRTDPDPRLPVYQINASLVSMGMLLPGKGKTQSERADFVLRYFDKLHLFRTGEISYDKNVLLFDAFGDEKKALPFVSQNGRWTSADVLKLGRAKDYWFSGDDITWKTDYFEKLGANSYEIGLISLHGSPDYHDFGITHSEVRQRLGKMNVQFLNFLSCNVGNFEVSNYLAGAYLESGSVLSVKAYSQLLFILTFNDDSALQYPFMGQRSAYRLMSRGHSVSDAHRYAESYADHLVLLGDPLLKFREFMVPATKFANVSAEKEGNKSVIKWKTTLESVGTGRFEIERSDDGENWSKIGEVESHDIPDFDYEFTDRNAKPDKNYYRIVAIDKDSRVTLSETREVKFSLLNSSVFPNPASNKLYITDDLVGSVRRIIITSMSGQEVLSYNRPEHNWVDISPLPSGVYFVRLVKTEGETLVFKIVIGE